MKKHLLPLALFPLVYSAKASLPFTDTFSNATTNGGTAYTVGTPLAGQTIAANTPPPVEPLIAAGTLSYSNLPASSGNSVSFFSSSGKSARLQLNATVTNGPAYSSYILKLTDISAVPMSPSTSTFGA